MKKKKKSTLNKVTNVNENTNIFIFVSILNIIIDPISLDANKKKVKKNLLT